MNKKQLLELKSLLLNDIIKAKEFLDNLIDNNDELDLISQIIIEQPPTKFTIKKKKVDPKTGKYKEDIYYLTANLFYAGTHYHVQSKITKQVKWYLVDYFKNVPKMSKMRYELIYCDMSNGWDLDNKAYFWTKMILDILKTPSNKQIANAYKRQSAIPTVNVLKDDTVKFIDEIKFKYKKDERKIIVNLYGRLEEEQSKLDL